MAASPRRDLIVIGGSAGALTPLQTIIASLPHDLPAAVLVVLHLSPHTPSHLPEILSRAGALPACRAEDGMPITPGQVVVAPPNRHLLVDDGVLRLSHGPHENSTRPAIDPLFRSAAAVYGPRVVAVLLSGMLDDGTFGLALVKAQGGMALVQDPAGARVSSMPASALRRTAVDAVLSAAHLGPALVAAVTAARDQSEEREHQHARDHEGDLPMDQSTLASPDTPLPHLSGYTCPSCHVVLSPMQLGEVKEFRCRIGHRFSPEAMTAQQVVSVEEALFSALNILEEREALMQELAREAEQDGSMTDLRRYTERARSARQRAAILRQVLEVPDEGPVRPPAAR